MSSSGPRRRSPRVNWIIAGVRQSSFWLVSVTIPLFLKIRPDCRAEPQHLKKRAWGLQVRCVVGFSPDKYQRTPEQGFSPEKGTDTPKVGNVAPPSNRSDWGVSSVIGRWGVSIGTGLEPRERAWGPPKRPPKRTQGCRSGTVRRRSAGQFGARNGRNRLVGTLSEILVCLVSLFGEHVPVDFRRDFDTGMP